MKRLILSLTVVSVVSVMFVSWLTSALYNYHNRDEFNDLRTQNLTSVLMGFSYFVENIDNAEDLLYRWSADSGLQVSLNSRKDFALPENLENALENGEVVILESDTYISGHLNVTNGTNVLSIYEPALSESSNVFFRSFVYTLAFYLGLVLLILLWVYPLIKRLFHIQRAAQDFGSGNLSSRVKTGGFSYIPVIEKSFNTMAGRIETLISDNKFLSNSISHELKTPLARIRFGIDTHFEHQNNLDSATYRKIDSDIDEMASLINTLLSYAKLESMSPDGNLVFSNIDQLITTELSKRTECKKICYVIPSEETFLVKIDEKYLRIVATNLIDNAIKFSRDEIRIEVFRRDSFIYFSIEDNGQGISEKNMANVFKPFWRAREDLNIKGHGMGLAIVDRILLRFKGEIVLAKSERLGGAKVTVALREYTP